MSRSVRRIPRIAFAALAAGALLPPGFPADPAAAQGQEAPPAPAVPVKVAEAVETEMAAMLWVPGTVVSRNDARIAAEIAGRLTWVAEVGDEVARGDVVARIDDRALELAAREAETRIRRLEVTSCRRPIKKSQNVPSYVNIARVTVPEPR